VDLLARGGIVQNKSSIGVPVVEGCITHHDRTGEGLVDMTQWLIADTKSVKGGKIEYQIPETPLLHCCCNEDHFGDINVDIRPEVKPDYVCDVTEKLPFKDYIYDTEGKDAYCLNHDDINSKVAVRQGGKGGGYYKLPITEATKILDTALTLCDSILKRIDGTILPGDQLVLTESIFKTLSSSYKVE